MTNHRDLSSFLAYAKRTGLSLTSTVYVGTHYEYMVRSSLRKYGFHLERTGGKSDLGIDLVGVWKPPSMQCEFKTFVQCKAGGTRSIGPSMLRELEGAFIGAPPGWKGQGVLGFLLAEQVATLGVRDSLRRSRWPMGFACCSKEGNVTQMIWNQSAAEAGLEGLEVGVAHVGDGIRAHLLHRGRPLPFAPEDEENSQ